MSTVLNDQDMQTRLARGELMRPGSWDASGIRNAAYDLRIAEDFLVIPDPDVPHGRRYHRGEMRTDPIILRPGDVAFLSTKERMCVPWDITGHIGIKFSYARKGMLVLTGLLVDPGFGLMQDASGAWIAQNDERLHFLVANVGPHTVALSPGREKLASVQFFETKKPAVLRAVESKQDMEREFFDANGTAKVGLSFFRDMADIRERHDRLEDRVRTVEAGTGQVVFFGVYLLAASIAAAALLGLLSLVTSDKLVNRTEAALKILPHDWPCALVVCAVLLATSWVLHSALGFIARLVARGK